MIPAVLGGPAPDGVIPISEPTLPDLGDFTRELEAIFASRQITNDRWVRRLEEDAARMIGVPEVVALSSATSGLVLVAKLLGLRGKVALPSFTFPATLHALLWNRLDPVLVDCDPETFNIDVDALVQRMGEGISCVVPVYIFGNAPDWDRLEPLLETRGVHAFSDAAHALGTRLGARGAGSFGDAEIFSLAPTKVTVSGEGGLVATRSRELARDLRIARNYGNPGSYDCLFAGLNARQSEIHALLGCLSLAQTEEHIRRRDELVRRYRSGLSDLPGLRFQRFAAECRTTHNYFAVRIDAAEFGLSNRELQWALDADGIRSKIYFYPPLHRQSRFQEIPGLRGSFPNTDRVCEEVLCLPLFSHMTDAAHERVVATVRACQGAAAKVRTLHAAKGEGH
jgi:dTDP-4-amino-4,6-dideoxygalactose transaminase